MAEHAIQTHSGNGNYEDEDGDDEDDDDGVCGLRHGQLGNGLEIFLIVFL